MIILLQLIHISDLERLSERVYMLTWLPNIHKCEMFGFILVLASLKMITLLFEQFAGNLFCRYVAVLIASTQKMLRSLLSMNIESWFMIIFLALLR